MVKLLTMPRLQCLEHLELNFFFMGEIFWEDCMLFLQLVSDFAPSDWGRFYNSDTHTHPSG